MMLSLIIDMVKIVRNPVDTIDSRDDIVTLVKDLKNDSFVSKWVRV